MISVNELGLQALVKASSAEKATALSVLLLGAGFAVLPASLLAYGLATGTVAMIWLGGVLITGLLYKGYWILRLPRR
jgi:hypothetical protein